MYDGSFRRLQTDARILVFLRGVRSNGGMLIPALAILLALQETAPYQGWKEAVTLRSKDGACAAVAVPEIAGRIIRFGRGDENILFENPDYLGKTLTNSAPEKLAQGYIGYQVDLGPELRRIPRHLPLWMGPAAWTSADGRVTLTSADDPAVGIRLQKVLGFDAATGGLDVLQKMRNVSEKEQSYCLWDRTLCAGGGFAFARLNQKSRFKAGWSLMKDGAYDGEAPDHPNVTVQDGILVAEAKGKSSKLGADVDSGWVAYVRGKQLFIKYFPVVAGGVYSDGGNSLEIYFDPKVCELEPLSPEVALKPGEEYAFPERWVLLALDREVATAAAARALAATIPPSPFKR